MPKRTRDENSSPNTSFSSPQANVVGEVQHLQLLLQNQLLTESIVADLLGQAFDILVNATDDEIVTGTIDGEGNLVPILNGLLLLSRKLRNTGAVVQLTPEYVKENDKQLYAICNVSTVGNDKHVISGNAFLASLCDAVNEENLHRKPSEHTSVESAEAVFASKVQNKKSKHTH